MEENNKTSDWDYYRRGFKLIGSFVASITLPIVIFILIGQYIDKRYSTMPLFTIIGFVSSVLLAGRIVYCKAKHYNEEYRKLMKK